MLGRPGLPHKMREAAVSEYHHRAGLGEDELVALFQNMEDFDEDRTRYQVMHILRRGYKPWRCATIRVEGFCLGEECPPSKSGRRKRTQVTHVTDVTGPVRTDGLSPESGGVEPLLSRVAGNMSNIGNLEKPAPSGESSPSRGTPAPSMTLQEKLKACESLGLDVQSRLGGDSLAENEFVDEAGQKLGYSSKETGELLKTLVRDGWAFRTVPGRIRFVDRAVDESSTSMDGTPAPSEADGGDIDQEKLRQVSEALRQYGPISVDDLAAGIGLPEKEVEKLLDRLRKEGHAFQQVGGYWRWQP